MRNLTTLLAFLSCSLLTASPANLYKKDNNFYLETQKISRAIDSLTSTAKAIAGPMGEAQLNSLGRKFKNRFGFNLLNKDELKKLGIDVQRPITASGIGAIDEAPVQFVVAIPAKDAQSAMQNIFKLLLAAKKLQPQNKWVLNDNKDGFYLIKPKPTAKGLHFLAAPNANWILLSESKAELKSLLAADKEKNLASDGFLSRLNKNGKLKKTYSNEFINFYASPDIMGDEGSIMALLGPGLAGEAAKKEIEKEMLENLNGFAANIVLSPNEIGLKTGYLFNEGFLESKDSLFKSMIASTSKPTLIDRNPGKPMILYGLLRMQLAKIIKFSVESSPTVKEEYDDFNKEFKDAVGLDFGQDVLPTLSGSFSLALHNIPAEENLYKPESYEAYLSFGLKDEGREIMNSLMKVVQEEAKKNPEDEVSIKELKAKQGNLWKVSIPMAKNKSRMPGEPPMAPGKEIPTEYIDIHVLITNSEVTLTSSLSNVESLSDLDKGLFIESLAKKPFSNTMLYSYINILEIRKYVERSSFGMLVGPYLIFVKNLESFHWDSSFGKNSVDTKLSIKIVQENQL